MSFAPDALNGLLARQMLSNLLSTSSPPPRMLHVGGLREAKSGISQAQGHAQAQALYDLYDVNPCEELCEDEGSPRHLEKKRRLSAEQVRSLEMSFEIESKLEPERKMQLASELGLQPRQVAVWFQNRRARWKTKQLERDYDHLKKEYDAVLFEKHKLEAEVFRLMQELQSAKQNETAYQQATTTTSDCTDGTAVLMIPKTREGELVHNMTTTTDNNNNTCEEQTMSPSFCSDAASNRKLPVDDINIQVVKAEEHEEKELSNNYDGFSADLKSEHTVSSDGQLYDYEYLIALDDHQHQGSVCFDWLNFYSHGKL